jgi:hypothetical protein
MTWIVQTSSASMPNSCWGIYRNVAVIKLTPEYAAANRRPKMMSLRARGVLDIYHFGHYHVGKTTRCAYQRVLQEAQTLANMLNDDSAISTQI